MSVIILLVSLFISFWMGALLVIKAIYRNRIPWPIFITFAIGMVGIFSKLFGVY